MIGAAAGYRANNRKESFHNGSWILKLAVATAVLIGLISVSWDIHESYDAFPTFLRRQLWPFVIDKTNLAPLRLLSFFALAVTATHFLPRNSGVLRCRSARLVILCGQHSLQVFCLGILLSMLGHILLSWITNSMLMQLAINVGGIALMIGIAQLLAWYKADKPARSHSSTVGDRSSQLVRKSDTQCRELGQLPPGLSLKHSKSMGTRLARLLRLLELKIQGERAGNLEGSR